jgi:glutathione S-transferase
MMKLYYSKGACSLAVRIVINEIGIQSEYEAVNLKTKQTEHGKDFLSINPKGAVPTIITDKQITLTEGIAIQQYLADKYEATQLLPAINDINRYKVIEWFSFVNNDLHKTCGALFNPTLPDEIKNTIYKPMLENKLNFMDQHLQHHTYIMDNQFTITDAYLFVVLSWLPLFNMDIAHWPALAKYSSEVAKRPSVQKSLAEEGLKL